MTSAGSPSAGSHVWWERARRLSEAAIRGDAHAAADLSVHVRPWVLRLAARQFPYRGDAEDVTQEVCVVVMRSAGGLRDAERLRSWLAAVTLNEVRAFYRSRKHEAERLRRAAGATPPTEAAPSRTSVLAGLRVDLLEGLERLPRHHAAALGLRQLGLSYEEIAAELSVPQRRADLFPGRAEPIPVGSVKRWVAQARASLAKAID